MFSLILNTCPKCLGRGKVSECCNRGFTATDVNKSVKSSNAGGAMEPAKTEKITMSKSKVWAVTKSNVRVAGMSMTYFTAMTLDEYKEENCKDQIIYRGGKNPAKNCADKLNKKNYGED